MFKLGNMIHRAKFYKSVYVSNKNDKGEEFRIYVPSASVDGGLSFPFSSDKANETMKISFTFKGKMATDYNRGEQLVRIESSILV